jgi:hypothetical protein
MVNSPILPLISPEMRGCETHIILAGVRHDIGSFKVLLPLRER